MTPASKGGELRQGRHVSIDQVSLLFRVKSMSYLAARYLTVCSIFMRMHRHRNSTLLRHQQGLSSLVSVGGLEAFLTRPELTGRY
jgi:hypothetical protein